MKNTFTRFLQIITALLAFLVLAVAFWVPSPASLENALSIFEKIATTLGLTGVFVAAFGYIEQKNKDQLLIISEIVEIFAEKVIPAGDAFLKFLGDKNLLQNRGEKKVALGVRISFEDGLAKLAGPDSHVEHQKTINGIEDAHELQIQILNALETFSIKVVVAEMSDNIHLKPLKKTFTDAVIRSSVLLIEKRTAPGGDDRYMHTLELYKQWS